MPLWQNEGISTLTGIWLFSCRRFDIILPAWLMFLSSCVLAVNNSLLQNASHWTRTICWLFKLSSPMCEDDVTTPESSPILLPILRLVNLLSCLITINKIMDISNLQYIYTERQDSKLDNWCTISICCKTTMGVLSEIILEDISTTLEEASTLL